MNIAIGLLIIVFSFVFAFFWGYMESMATAPQYDNVPYYIFFSGIGLGIVFIGLGIASLVWP